MTIELLYEDPEGAYDSPTVELSQILDDVIGHGQFTFPKIGGEAVEMVMYVCDDEESYGFILAVRTAQPTEWSPVGVQVATSWQDTGNVLARKDDGTYDMSPTAMLVAVQEVLSQANALLPYLQAMANGWGK